MVETARPEQPFRGQDVLASALPLSLHYFTYRMNECAVLAHVLCCVGVRVCVCPLRPSGRLPSGPCSSVPAFAGVCRTSSESHRPPSGIRPTSEICLMAAFQRESICGAPQRVVFLAFGGRTRWLATHLITEVVSCRVSGVGPGHGPPPDMLQPMFDLPLVAPRVHRSYIWHR